MPDQPRQSRPVVDFDHLTPTDVVDPDEAWKRLRERCPVAWSDHHGGFWAVSKHEDVARVFKDHKTFSSARNEFTNGTAHTIPSIPELVPQIPEELDPPRFHGYRRLLNGVLSPKIVATMQPTVERLVTHFIDEFIEQGECDFVYDLTSPLPGAVALGWLGFDQQDWRWIGEAYHDFIGYPRDHERSRRAFAAVGRLDGLIAELISERRREARDDVMSYLVAQKVDGEPIGDEQVHGMVSLLIGGGVDTTTSLMTSTLVHLSQHPEQRERLSREPELWPTATEEFLRRYPPIRSHARTVTQDVEVGGCPMRRGDRVLISERSACHDEDAFRDAHEVMLDRFPNRHVAFGLGIHRCPGMHLAKLMFREVVTQVLERMPDYRVLEDQLRGYHVQGAVAGWQSAPAVFSPGGRRAS